METSTTSQDQAYAPALMRDQFLDALEGHDDALARRLAQHLTQCGNPLPSATCIELGLPVGSSYGRAARAMLVPRP